MQRLGPSNRLSSAALPLAFIALGVACLFSALCLVASRPELLSTYHYNQHVIAVTHLVVLGWICSVIMGATYQLVPVALEIKLFSERFARWQFVFHLTGLAGMISGFWVWNLRQTGSFGLVLALGVLLFLYNLARTLARIRHWNVVAASIASALVWLLLTILAGLLLVAGKLWGIARFDPISQMHAHAHLGGIGFFLILIVGVSYKLVPMFLLAEVGNQRRAWASIIILNLGLAGLAFSMLVGSAFKLAFALFVTSGLVLYGLELIAILRSRKRRVLDWGLKYFLTGVALLVPVCALAIPLSWSGLPLTELTGQLENAYGLLALLGVVSLAILGMLYKIVPFLVWYSRYSRDIGRFKVPALADLYSTVLQAAGYWIFLAGLVLTSIATIFGHAHCVRIGAELWLVSIGIFGLNMWKICLHLRRPATEGVPLAAAMKGIS